MESLRNLIMIEHSRSQADFVSDIVIKKPELLPELLDIIFAREEPVSRRAAWPLRILSQKDIDIINPFVPVIIDQLPKMDIVPILKLLLAVLVVAEIPETCKGEMLQITTEILTDTGSSIASLIYSMDIFYKLSVDEPDLLNELKLMLEMIIPFGSPGRKK